MSGKVFASCLCGVRAYIPLYCLRCNALLGSPGCEDCGRPHNPRRVNSCPECDPVFKAHYEDDIRRECGSQDVPDLIVRASAIGPCGHPATTRSIWCGACQRNHCATCVEECRRKLTSRLTVAPPSYGGRARGWPTKQGRLSFEREPEARKTLVVEATSYDGAVPMKRRTYRVERGA